MKVWFIILMAPVLASCGEGSARDAIRTDMAADYDAYRNCLAQHPSDSKTACAYTKQMIRADKVRLKATGRFADAPAPATAQTAGSQSPTSAPAATAPDASKPSQ
jgi:hypothetical protein